MKDPLKQFIIAVSGDFGESRSHSAMERWIGANGGKFATAITDDTTHLVCTYEDWKQKAEKVRAARKLKGVKIVTYDWLEDSLMKKQRRNERPYLLTKVEADKRKREKQEARKARAAEACSKKDTGLSPEEVVKTKYHPYRDADATEYAVTLTRNAARRERHTLTIYESDGWPHLYTTVTKYIRPGRSASEFLVPLSSFYETAFDAFCHFFLKKTGVAWENRFQPGTEKADHGADSDEYYHYSLSPRNQTPTAPHQLSAKA